MKKILSNLTVVVLAVLSMSFVTGCKEPGFGDFSLSVKECGPDYVDLFLTAPETIEFAYDLSTKPLSAVNPSVLFATGTVIAGSPGDVIKIQDDIVQNTKHYLYAVAKLSATKFSDVIELEFTTKKYEFSDVLTVVDTYYDGYKVHVTVPESVKQNKNALRYSLASVAVYNKIKNTYGTHETDMLLTNGGPYTRYIKNDSTLVFTDNNLYEVNEKGEVIYDDQTGDVWTVHDPIVPGEPSIFMVGEYKWGDVKEFGFSFGGVDKETGFDHDKGYFLPLYDWAEDKWTGTYSKKEFLVKEPSPLEAEVKIDVSGISCIDAIVTITPDPYEPPTENEEDYGKPNKGVFQYLYTIVDVATYQAMMTMLDDKEEYIQWFLTSYLAMFELGCESKTGPITVNAASHFTEPLEAGKTYYILLTAMGDLEGKVQRFYKKEFTAAARTKPGPRIVVTAYPQDKTKPYEASFNVKAPDGDLMGAYYACNAAREFELLLNADFTYPDILKGNYSFSQDELDLINSPSGYDMTFYTLDGEVTRLAVYGCNDEYTFNNMKVGETTAVADYTAPYAQRTPEVVSSLYDELAGTWVATATLSAKQVDEETEETLSYNLTYSSEVVIGKTAPAVPEKVENFVYDLYPKKSKAEVDDMLEVLKTQSDIFTENRLTNRNRLLCTGFIDFDYYKNPGRMDARTPYDLFKATDYSSIDEAQLLNDFGPKWYLEVLEGDRVIVPFNDTLVPPMHNWPGYPFHVGAYDRASNYFFTKTNSDVLGFPVEISSDKNTITIKPIVLLDQAGNEVKYYMNAVGFNGNEFELVAPVITDIVLKRKTVSESASPVQVKGLVSTPVKAQPRNFGETVVEIPRNRVYKSMTPIKEPIRYQVDEYPNVITTEEFNNALDNYIEKHYNIKMK